METILQIFRGRNWQKTRLKLEFFSCHNIKLKLLWLILKWYTILENFFLLDSVRYHSDAKTALKVWLVQPQDPDVRLISQIHIFMCFIINISTMSWRYIEDDVTLISLQYQNIHWVMTWTGLFHRSCPCSFSRLNSSLLEKRSPLYGLASRHCCVSNSLILIS